MRSAQQRRWHDIRGGANLGGIEGRLAKRSFCSEIGIEIDQQQKNRGSDRQYCAPTAVMWSYLWHRHLPLPARSADATSRSCTTAKCLSGIHDPKPLYRRLFISRPDCLPLRYPNRGLIDLCGPPTRFNQYYSKLTTIYSRHVVNVILLTNSQCSLRHSRKGTDEGFGDCKRHCRFACWSRLSRSSARQEISASTHAIISMVSWWSSELRSRIDARPHRPIRPLNAPGRQPPTPLLKRSRS
jgi:hypothetical protein